MPRQFLAFCLVFCAPTCASFAHEDRIISLEGGNLTGLPQQYQPARLDLTAFRITLRGHTVAFSAFLKSLFDKPYDLDISAHGITSALFCLHTSAFKPVFAEEKRFSLRARD